MQHQAVYRSDSVNFHLIKLYKLLQKVWATLLTTNMSSHAHPQVSEVHHGNTHGLGARPDVHTNFKWWECLGAGEAAVPQWHRIFRKGPCAHCSVALCSQIRGLQTAFSFPIQCGSAGLHLGRTSTVTLLSLPMPRHFLQKKK